MKLDLSGISVHVAMPAHRDIPVETCASLLKTQDALWQRGIPFEMQVQVGSSLVVAARSKAVHCFLKGSMTRLFWVDSDIVWEPDAFMRLLAMTSVMDVVIAAYPMKKDPARFVVAAEGDVTTNEWGCLPNVGTGLGFACMRREVIEALCKKAPVLEFPDVECPIPHLFRTDSIDGRFRGEDIAFYSDIRDAGYTVYLDPSITLGHHGAKTYAGRLSDQLEEFEYHGTP